MQRDRIDELKKELTWMEENPSRLLDSINKWKVEKEKLIERGEIVPLIIQHTSCLILELHDALNMLNRNADLNEEDKRLYEYLRVRTKHTAGIIIHILEEDCPSHAEQIKSQIL